MKEIKITSNGIKQAIDDLVNENELLQKQLQQKENIIKEVRKYKEQLLFDLNRGKCFEKWEEILNPIDEILDKVGDEK